MPALVFSVKAIYGVAGFWAASTFAVGFVIGRTILFVAISYAANRIGRLLTKKPSSSAEDLTNSGRTLTVREPAASRKIIYGQARVGGVLVYIATSGTDKEYLHMLIAHAGHECEEIVTVYLNDVEVPLDGSGNATGTYAGYVTVKKHLGSTTQTYDTDLEAAVGAEWTSAHRLRGICYSYLRLKHSPDLFPAGIPNYSALIKGKKVYDPRSATTVWSANAALCIRDYLTDTSLGLGADSAEIDDAAVITAANICDENVNLNPSGTEDRYTINGVIDTATQPGSVLSDMLGAMAGICPYIGGQFKMKAGAHTASVQSLTVDDARGPIRFTTGDSLRDCFNGVKGVYIAEKNAWQPADFPPVVNSTYTSEDGGARIWRDIALPFTTSSATAQRLAKIELERSRQDFTVQFPAKLTALNVQVGDVVDLTISRYGWSAKLFEVVDFVFVVDDSDKAAPKLGIDLVLRETASGVWDWNSGEETTVDLALNTTLKDPTSVPGVGSFAAAVAATAERTALPRVKLTWTAPARVDITNGGFTDTQFKKNAESDWTDWSSVPGSTLFDYVSDLEVGTTYNFRARHRNIHGVRGAWCTPVNVVALAGLGTYTAMLTNEAHSVSCDSAGTPIAGELGVGGRAVSDVLAFAGATGLTAVTSSPGVGQFSISIATFSGTATWTKVDDDTVRCDSISTDSAVGRVTIDLEGVLTVYKDFTLTKVNSGTDGDPGTDGDDATVYWLVPDAAAVNKTIAGSYTPSTLNLSAFSKTGAAAPAAYSGRFKIATFDGATWTDVYTSAGDESTNAYTVPASILAIRSRLYLAGGTTTLVDEQIVPIVTDGATGATGATGAAGSNGAAVAADNGSFSAIGLNSGGQSTAVTVSKTPVSTSCLVTAACTMENLDAVADSGVTVRVYRDSTVIGTFENFDLAAYETEVGKPLVIADTGLTGGVTYSYTIKCYRTVSGATIDCQSCSLSIVG